MHSSQSSWSGLNRMLRKKSRNVKLHRTCRSTHFVHMEWRAACHTYTLMGSPHSTSKDLHLHVHAHNYWQTVESNTCACAHLAHNIWPLNFDGWTTQIGSATPLKINLVLLFMHKNFLSRKMWPQAHACSTSRPVCMLHACYRTQL